MVRFEEDKLVIELKVESADRAVQRWENLHDALCLVFEDVSVSSEKPDLTDGYYYLFDFLRELIPDYKDTKKMAIKTN